MSTRLHLSPDRKAVALFYLQALSASARVHVRIDGDNLTDDAGNPVDADGDGLAGGVATINFSTLSLTLVPITPQAVTDLEIEATWKTVSGVAGVPIVLPTRP